MDEARARSARGARFVWPPRPGAVEPREDDAARVEVPGSIVVRGDALVAPAAGGRIAELWRAIQRDWLDMTAAPLAERFAAADWRPDSPGAYCAKCGLTTLDGDRFERGCDKCEGRRPAWERIVRLGEYRGLLAGVVREIKFSRWRRLGVDLGRVMGRELARVIAEEARGGVVGPVVLVPVPMSRWRRIVRGMDHSLAICRGVRAGLKEAGVASRISRLLGRRHGPSQLAVLPSERAANVGRRIYAKGRKGFCQVPEGVVLVVVDDVMTTGATMQGSCRGLREGLKEAGRADCRVWGLVAARTELADGDRDDGP